MFGRSETVGRRDFDWWDDAARALEVAASEFVVATAATADIREFAPLSALLLRMQRAFGIDAAFVSDCHAECATGTLQMAYGMRLLEANAPSGRFRFEAVPVVTGEGSWRGTLCCRLPLTREGSEDGALLSVARLIARWFEEAQAA
jgi:hypothetical protein